MLSNYIIWMTSFNNMLSSFSLINYFQMNKTDEDDLERTSEMQYKLIFHFDFVI